MSSELIGGAIRAVKESAVWRSLFRQPYPNTSRTRALAVMNNVFLHLHPVRVKRHAVRYTYTFCLGGISFFLFLALTVTGLYLMFFYVPSIANAYQDIQAIEASVAFGSLVRNMHRWAAHLMVLTVFLHMIRVFYHGAYKPPREFNWVVGVLLLFCSPCCSASPGTCCRGTRSPSGRSRSAPRWRSTRRSSARRPASSCSAASRSGRRRCCASTCCT